MLTGFEDEGEAHLNAYEASYNQPGFYVDLNEVFHIGPRMGVLEREDMDTELSEETPEDCNRTNQPPGRSGLPPPPLVPRRLHRAQPKIFPIFHVCPPRAKTFCRGYKIVPGQAPPQGPAQDLP